MKLTKQNNTYIVSLYKDYLKIDTTNKKELEEYLKKLLIKMNNLFHQKFTGFYQVTLYQNDNYGFIAVFEKEEDLDYFKDLIDLRIQILFQSPMFLALKDYFIIPKNTSYYYDNNNFYININDIKNEYLSLCEFGRICYLEDEIKSIRKNSLKKKKD